MGCKDDPAYTLMHVHSGLYKVTAKASRWQLSLCVTMCKISEIIELIKKVIKPAIRVITKYIFCHNKKF